METNLPSLMSLITPLKSFIQTGSRRSVLLPLLLVLLPLLPLLLTLQLALAPLLLKGCDQLSPPVSSHLPLPGVKQISFPLCLFFLGYPFLGLLPIFLGVIYSFSFSLSFFVGCYNVYSCSTAPIVIFVHTHCYFLFCWPH